MPPTVFPATRSADWYRTHLFVAQASPTVWSAEKARIRTLEWKRPAKIRITACMLCCTRPIDAITIPQGDTYLLERLGLTHLGDTKNRKLAQQLREFP
ncbi:MAG TPA: hypothetical protein VHW09_26960 [Bryobacteraceae bacterium]|jgi:hypothetical protein|nr:hypothetical protein [Bryobacteraceae bacterium]